MKTIWKYKLELSNMIRLKIPKNGKILTFQMQYNIPCLWILIDTEEKEELRLFEIYDTGQAITVDIENDYKYISTIQQGNCVWHLFEYKPSKNYGTKL